MLILDLISDTHTKHDGITFPQPLLNQEDTWVLVHTGDFSYQGLPHEVNSFKRWLQCQPHYYKVLIAGNHELTFENLIDGHKEFSKCANTYYLQETGCEIAGYKFWGTPYTMRFFDWAFQVDRGVDDHQRFSKIPNDTDIVLCHGPAQGVADTCPDINDRNRIVSVGSSALRKRLKAIEPKLMVSGHLHKHAGVYAQPECLYVNASVLDDRYEHRGWFHRAYLEVGKPIRVEKLSYL